METNIQERIAQWEHMTQEDPKDFMGWFSLGNAYRDADRLEDAVNALARCLEINPGMSRAYQLRAQCLIQLDRNDEAAETLAKGYAVAAEKGDVMPQKAMESLLHKLGRPVPEIAPAQATQPLGANMIVDRRTGQPGTRLPDPPMRGPLGKFIFDHYSQETWREWIRTGTKVINELRLDFSNTMHQKLYDQHMLEWLGLTEQDVAEYAERQAEAGKKTGPSAK